jgi:hypothetical protein
MELIVRIARRALTRRAARRGAAVALVATVAILQSCAKGPGSLELKSVTVGSAVDAEEKVTTKTREFAPGDTVFVAIGTEGAGARVLHVQWFTGLHPASTESRKIEANGPRSFAFHFAPPGGWPAGKSRALFWLDDDQKHTADFEVR